LSYLLTGAALKAFEAGAKSTIKTTREQSVSILGYDFLGLVSRLGMFFIIAFLINAYFVASIKGNIWLNSAANVFGFHFPQTLPQYLVDLFTVGIGPKPFEVSATPTAAGMFNPPDWDKKFEVGGEFAGLKYFDYGSISHHQAKPDYIPPLATAGITITFWQIIQIIAVILVIVEAMQYSKKLKEKTLEYPNGQRPNVTTLGVFSLLALGLSLITFPQIIQKVQEMRIVNK